MKKYFISLIFATLILMSCATHQERAEHMEMIKKTVVAAMAKRQIHIDVMSMNTMRYGTRSVTLDFFLELHGDSLRSYLPYLGQAHQAPMLSPSQGLNFDEQIHYSCDLLKN